MKHLTLSVEMNVVLTESIVFQLIQTAQDNEEVHFQKCVFKIFVNKVSIYKAFGIFIKVLRSL